MTSLSTASCSIFSEVSACSLHVFPHNVMIFWENTPFSLIKKLESCLQSLGLLCRSWHGRPHCRDRCFQSIQIPYRSRHEVPLWAAICFRDARWLLAFWGSGASKNLCRFLIHFWMKIVIFRLERGWPTKQSQQGFKAPEYKDCTPRLESPDSDPSPGISYQVVTGCIIYRNSR